MLQLHSNPQVLESLSLQKQVEMLMWCLLLMLHGMEYELLHGMEYELRHAAWQLCSDNNLSLLRNQGIFFFYPCTVLDPLQVPLVSSSSEKQYPLFL